MVDNYKEDVMYFQDHPEFMRCLKENAIMVCEAWGWDLIKGKDI